MQILTYLHDPDNLYKPILKNLKIPPEIAKGVISISPPTTSEVKGMAKDLPFQNIVGGLYGESRIKLLKFAVNNLKEDYYLICDFDKLIHWINTKPSELVEIVNTDQAADVTIIGRSSRALATYPETWVQTEAIATKVLAKIIKKKVDFMNGPLIVSKKAAEILASNAKELRVGSCVEFCLLANQANLKIDSVEVDGLTWEDPDRYESMIEKAPSYDDWKYDTYNSLYEWRKRVEFLNIQVETMIRLENEPINPKYPLVHNKTIEINGD